MRLTRRPSRVPARHERGAPLLEAREVAVHLGGHPILDDVDLTVHAGEVLALVGPNGAGKSTLLAALCGDVALGAGTISVDGAPATSWTHIELAMRRAVLPQQALVSFPFRVHEVVRMGRAPWTGTEREDRDDEAIANALRDADVEHLAERQFTTLSGGEQARASLARVLAQEAQVLLLDEPTASLDVQHQELVLELAGRRADAGDGVVVVLHDLGLAAAHADTVVVLSRGRVVTAGPSVEVMQPGLLSEVYRHAIDVLSHPVTGGPLVVPRRLVREDRR